MSQVNLSLFVCCLFCFFPNPCHGQSASADIEVRPENNVSFDVSDDVVLFAAAAVSNLESERWIKARIRFSFYKFDENVGWDPMPVMMDAVDVTPPHLNKSVALIDVNSTKVIEMPFGKLVGGQTGLYRIRAIVEATYNTPENWVYVGAKSQNFYIVDSGGNGAGRPPTQGGGTTSQLEN